MNQLYEKKCDCEQYDNMKDHRAALIKMEVPDDEEIHYSNTSYTICRAIRVIVYVVAIILSGYALWRIHVVEAKLVASERFANITRYHTLNYHRVSRSIKSDNPIDYNSFGLGDKELPKGGMLTAKNENTQPIKKSSVNKEEFDYLVESLFNKIIKTYNDNDRSHFDNNMKAVFQAWFPVFDALLPRELMGNRDMRSAKSESPNSDVLSEVEKGRYARSPSESSEESSEEKKEKNVRSPTKSSEESSEEKKERHARSAPESSEESSEEKKERYVRSPAKSSEESSEEKKEKNVKSPTKSSEESSEEKKERHARSTPDSSEESSEEKKERYARSVSKSSEESSEEKNEVYANSSSKSSEESEENKQRTIRCHPKSSEESSESEDSSEESKQKSVRCHPDSNEESPKWRERPLVKPLPWYPKYARPIFTKNV